MRWEQDQKTYRRLVFQNDMRTLSSPAEFEQYTAALLQAQGYTTRVTGRSHDGGIDVRVTKGDTRAIVQCKYYHSGHKVGVKDIREFAYVISREQVAGFFVTSSTFTKGAISEASNVPTLVLVDSHLLSVWAQRARRVRPAAPPPAVIMARKVRWPTLALFIVSDMCLIIFGIVMPK